MILTKESVLSFEEKTTTQTWFTYFQIGVFFKNLL